MSPALKTVLYVVFLIGGVFCGIAVKNNLSGGPTLPDGETAPVASNSTPAQVSGTNEAAAQTNVLSPAPPDESTDVLTNSIPNAAALVQPLVTNSAAEPASEAVPSSATAAHVRAPTRHLGQAVALGGVGFLCLVGLGLLIGRDVAHFMAARVDRLVFNDDLLGVKDPEYEQAEEIWKAGRHLEAVQLMRDYYRRHPSEVYVALRIAEIYEADLKNYLASALEYEEVLKRKLPAERWGWAAIHLANLYSGRLNRPADATELLRRIVEEFGHTGAARKARHRLGIPEPVEETTPSEPAPAAEAAPEPQARGPIRVTVVGKPASHEVNPAEPQPEPEPPPSLPRGFRPKK